MAIRLGARSPKHSELWIYGHGCSLKPAVPLAGMKVCVSVGRPSSRVKVSLTRLIHE